MQEKILESIICLNQSKKIRNSENARKYPGAPGHDKMKRGGNTEVPDSLPCQSTVSYRAQPSPGRIVNYGPSNETSRLQIPLKIP